MSSGFTPYFIGQYFNGVVKGGSGSQSSDGWTFYSFDGPEVLLNMYDSGNISFARIESVFANISDSLTIWIRSNGVENYSDPAVGQVYHYATCLRVHWEWITYPSLLAVLTMLLLILTISSRTNEQVPIWKASFLPWLMYGPQGSGALQNDASTISSQETEELVDMSKTIKVTWRGMADSLVSWKVVP
ncbi:hypothetical protein F4808DRAFT_439230 [Astrocystis sublimbata]|nr:hypothetical protein F4808DRAFT_439230 [Astrocystis sublimbata]